MPRKTVEIICQFCGNPSTKTVGNDKKAKYCSAKCSGKASWKARQVEETQRFFSKVSKGEPLECWPYIGGKTGAGYGAFWSNGKQKLAHIYAYELENGPIEKTENRHDTVVRHKCDNPCCCNPHHLILGTQSQNNQDKIDRHRDGIGGGKKLTPDDVYAILESPLSSRKVGPMFGISQRTVCAIRSGKAWKHLP